MQALNRIWSRSYFKKSKGQKGKRCVWKTQLNEPAADAGVWIRAGLCVNKINSWPKNRGYLMILGGSPRVMPVVCSMWYHAEAFPHGVSQGCSTAVCQMIGGGIAQRPCTEVSTGCSPPLLCRLEPPARPYKAHRSPPFNWFSHN